MNGEKYTAPLPQGWDSWARTLAARAADPEQDDYSRRFAAELLNVLPDLAALIEGNQNRKLSALLVQ